MYWKILLTMFISLTLAATLKKDKLVEIATEVTAGWIVLGPIFFIIYMIRKAI